MWNKAYAVIVSLSVGVVPGPPTDLAVTEATKSYMVLSWKPPIQRGHEGVMYYVEKVRQNVNSIKYLIFPCVFNTFETDKYFPSVW